ncbi:uncharacterized protein [Physcomitrium patens]|uniref:Uncharacterized protein n=1 Tax=Physcomitrium patens TaxID=3218 RepID=A0A2K1JUV1_PHYPA|nr:uncharacterized protein LOC112288659 isoform X1 [Physcomitrium patens]XP_024388861.1 uncharacterized protein LOC112288659 isoform X1 [Physcomitrium patens]XP_024388862.1 uncharacterized protein LOC112288659 isoform X1 [Physcomitrium patens]XP_024388863.1 uncharacterized protein LOC112288659 isoform X1 [Physcomitrium patens]XP_024388864.1 uncharacterized protein LOC112288659 isoform X1 [Physcomitrium patens]PNR45295.1 hypothetical protein PHYPA_015066 [Physcomitrium patens]|eukprot:XP_024388860.1 uncharacterized protein LOC112288659 isoform X1 [Physcomitrella patens]
MATSWSFTLLLILTVVAFITYSQPLFHPAPAPLERRKHLDLEIVPQAAIARGAPQRNLPTFKASDVESYSDGSQSSGTLNSGSQRQRSTRKLIQRQVSSPCDDQQRHVICRRKRRIVASAVTRPSPDADRPPQTRPCHNLPHAEPAIPRRSISAHFESDRMVPTGPNPLHNSNRSQVIFP